MTSPFYEKEKIVENEHAFAVYDKHLDPSQGTTFNMEEEVKLVTGKLHDGMTAITRRSRASLQTEVIGKLKEELQDKTPKTLQGDVVAASQILMDVLFCNFEENRENG